MLKPALDALGAGLRLLDLATLVVAIPLATANRGWVADRPWGATTTDAFAAAVVLALALTIGARLGWRALATSTRLASRAARGGVTLERRAEVRVPPASRSLDAPAAAPPPSAEEVGTSERVLDGLRACMDEVSYVPGDPNVLSMTKYVRGGDGALPAKVPCADDPGARAPGRAEPAVSFSRRDDGDRTVLEIGGVLDAVAAPALRPTFDELVAERRTSITIELSALRLIDSSGVGLVVSLYKRCRTFGGVVHVSGVKDQPLAIFKLLRLDRIFTLA